MSSEMLTIKGASLSSAMTSAVAIQDMCEDFMVSDVTNKNCYYNGDFNGLQFTDDIDVRHINPLTRHSLSQLCAKLGVPVRYIQSCIDKGYPDLAADNINAWLDEYRKSLFIRTYGDRIRGVLSDRYTTLDSPEVIEVCEDTFGDDFKVKGMYVSEERLHLRIVQKNMLKVKGEDLFAGVTIDSSDVGRSILCVRFLIYKQVCTNGLCISEGMGSIFAQRHVGISKDEFREGLVASLQSVPAIIPEIMDAIQCANRYDKELIDYRGFNEEKQDRFVSRIRALTKLPEDGVAKILETMYDKYSVSRWGFVNSITEVAQDYTLDRRLELENVAGKILLNGGLIVA